MRVALGLLVVLALAGPAVAQPAGDDEKAYEAGLKSYLDGDPGSAWFFWIGPAERGNRDAQFSIGHLYRAGEGVPADPKTAADWFARAAAQGDAHAMLNLALMHEQGLGVSRDLALAYAYAARAGRLLEGEEFERAKIAAARIAVGFSDGDPERARRLIIDMDRRQPLGTAAAGRNPVPAR
ncbi:MAG: sel1 repeat family protein [Rhodospirillales bacterium]|nr:sel1 repeat family protein [Rhodospirillales bacterium]